MKHTVKFIPLALVGLAATPTQAAEGLQFHGYARAGAGLNPSGGGQVCFQLAGADVKWRLGNECDYVIEPNFNYDILTLDDKSTWGFHVMPSIYKAYEPQGSLVRDDAGAAIGTASWFDDLPVRFGQIYFYGKNVPLLRNGTIWIGRRFYDRLQLGINDQFVENEDGDGAGVEDVDVGFAKWSIAFLMNPNDTPRTTAEANPVGDVNNKVFKITTRFTNIRTVKDGALQVWAAARNLQSKSTRPAGAEPAEVDTTYRVGVYHSLVLGRWGSNLTGFKFETLADDANLWRVFTQQGMTLFAARTALDFIAEYRRTSPDTGDDQSWFAVGARADTHLTGLLRFLLEAGYDWVDDADSRNLTKVTAALAMSPGREASVRPTFRLFYTHGFWSDEGVLASARTNDVYGDDTSGGSFGLQAEGWW